MPDIGKAFKDEIRRLAKSEAKSATDPLKKSITELRASTWKLKRQTDKLAKQLSALQPARSALPATTGKTRYSARTDIPPSSILTNQQN